ncbi:MAG: lipopolysaccharide biosynthesis protein [Candidatus Omnitrophica bacterium]|nr:lipopolysaccharide biosynthesis protein [Candidatus Omnitrophota bacterium]
MALKQETISGIKWQVGMSLAQKAISFLGTIILARHLGPSVFGLFAFAMVIEGSFELFKSMGIDSALIRRQGDFKKAANTAFLIIPLLGVALFLAMFFSAPSIGNMLGNKDIVPILRALGIIFVFSCFARVPSAILEKRMEFKRISIAEFYSSILFTGFAIIFAFLSFEVWSLVFAYIIKTFFYMVMVFMFARWRFTFDFDIKLAKEMIVFGKFIFLATLVAFLKSNLDNLLVGKLLGVTMLGYYAVAFNVANLCYDYIGSKIGRVIYPAYSKLSRDFDNMRNAFLKTFKYTAIFVIPIGLGTFFLAKDFLLLAYGEKWVDAYKVLQILAWAGIFNTLPVPLRAIFFTMNKPNLAFFMSAIQVVIFFIFITPAAKMFMLNGVGIVVSVSSFMAFIISLFWGMRLLSITYYQIYACLKPALVASFYTFSVMIILRFLFMTNKFIISFNGAIAFASIVLIAVFMYIAIIQKTEKDVSIDLKLLIWRKLCKN